MEFELVFITNSKAYIEATQLNYGTQYFLDPAFTNIANTGGNLFPLALNKYHIVQTGLIYI